ncbi:3-isopropylmalate dehydrogenase [Staphylococcus auricularis]|uniref:5-methylcytosine-specific restriction enzyme subunit McrC n=2 Tax=Staphylococcus auricularis TaxID=29379 RepID=A0AAP8PNP7_9STAP|nr:hypothetical protein [Staphylococcus auricularis]MBM0868312.1 hypothetical protein [Staphylococcus auricularis]MCG7341995.1 hypothetical protein [Staphylococcus auricularis]PNZ66720.1 hypothetical protein CD158_07845 [Staphylococcus auricularis]QPT06178.1 hypothetical protein I6G39_00385 [Staphylococcus auricularis]BCU51277.1 3-isopropylmalate dehydrogenase [Staphylococcus auricularis]
MKLIKIKDNSFRASHEFNEIPKIISSILNKTVSELKDTDVFVFPNSLKEMEGMTKDQMILNIVNQSYHSGNIMGFLGFGEEHLIIESRFSEGPHDYFFQYLIENVLKIPYVIDLNTIIDKENKIISLFIFIFPYYLRKAMRKGLFKQYVRNEYNNQSVKGTIDIPRHIKKNTPFVGNIAYSLREFSYDNDMLQLIRHTIEFIKKRKEGTRVLSTVRNEVKKVYEVTQSYNHMDRNKVIMLNQQRPIRHAYYKEYRELQKLCLTILQRHKHYMGTGPEKINGILFDGAWLWEEYIDTLVNDAFYHPKNKGGTGAQKLFSRDEGQKVGLIYPDFISRNQEHPIIGDAKYKPVQNIRNKDYLQILAYMFRFDAKIGCYFYPNHSTADNEVLYLNQGLTYEKNEQKRENIKVIKLGLKIPQNVEDYQDFTEKMKQSEKQFLSQIQFFY